MTEIYEYCENKQKTTDSIMKQGNVDKNNKNVIHENITDGFDTYMQEKHTDSDSTVIYENQEKEIGTIYFLHEETINRDHHKHQSLPHLLYFKCPQTNCKFRSNKRKVTNNHYRLEHKKKKNANTAKSLTVHHIASSNTFMYITRMSKDTHATDVVKYIHFTVSSLYIRLNTLKDTKGNVQSAPLHSYTNMTCSNTVMNILPRKLNVTNVSIWAPY